jgi:NRAMP (natural resistance-associated macrophage protein)-like metal ion transporter
MPMTGYQKTKAKRHRIIPRRFRRFFGQLGPGLITGAADDDPSGISTYSVTGASFGYAPLWTALFSFPLMVAVQLMCARLGLVTGEGLAGVIRRRYPKWVLWGACVLLVVANTVNIGADLGGMGQVTGMLTGIRSVYWTPLYAILIGSFLIWSSYYRIARIFKWLTLLLFSYVLAAFFAKPDWAAVIRATFVPHVEWTGLYWATLVGIFGTTISPYLFFWQASQEVEEEREHGELTLESRQGATDFELRKSRNDVVTGMFFSNIIMYFIILTTAATLHAHGKTTISTAEDAAEALRPLAGKGAYWLFSLGLIGAGMIGVPVLAGSSAYAVSEGAVWRGSLADKAGLSRGFYGVIAAGLVLGMALGFAGFNAVAMLF